MKVQTTKVYAQIQKGVDSGFTTISEQGSSRSSKTYNTLIWLIVYCLSHPNTALSIVRKTLPAIKGSVYRDFRDIMMNGMKLWQEKRMNKTEMIYEFPNGSFIEFFSTDNEQKLRGRKRDVLFVNEANEISFLEWQQLKMRTTRFSIIDYNPSFTDEHWICGVNADPRTFHFVTTYKDNPFLEQTIVDEIESLKDKNPTLWQVYGLGLQAVIEGLIFKNVSQVDAIPDHIRRKWVGMDFGYTNDPTAIGIVAIDGNDLYIDEVCYRTEMLSSDIISVLKEEVPKFKIISESADPRLIQEIYRAGLNIHPVQKFKGSIEAGITKMLEYNIKVTRRSTNTLKEFRNYTYSQDKEGKWLNVPIDAFNHMIDASRYVVINEVLGGVRRKPDMDALARAAY